MQSARMLLPPDHVLVVDSADGGYADYRTLVARATDAFVPEAVASEDVFNIMYTSGTTGQPKGIVHTHFIRAMYATLLTSGCG